MADIRIITPTGMFGPSDGDCYVTTAMRVIGVGFGEEGNWCAKYGVNAETEVFAMRVYYSADDCDCGLDEKAEVWHKQNKGHPDYDEQWKVFLKDNPRHLPTCSLALPNFLYKPTGFALEWYKYIGRGMKVKVDAPLPSDFMDRIFATHPKGMTLEQAIAETARQEEETANRFTEMFKRFNVKMPG